MTQREIADRQREQLKQYLKWVNEEGGDEGPTRLSTWFKPWQVDRLKWLSGRCVGIVAEFGSNYGYVLAYCNGHIGIDYNEKSVHLAKILSPERQFFVGDIRNVPLTDKSVDTVLLTDVLEHISWDSIPQAIAEALRVARRKVLITLPRGDIDTEEAVSPKHQWLATPDRIDEIKSMFNRYSSTIVTSHFYMIDCGV